MKPIQRLREEFRTIEKGSKSNKQLRRIKYFAMRSFCLDCELVTFQEVEQMEYEVDNELKSLVE